MDNNNYCNPVPLSMLSPHSIENCVANNCEIVHLIIILRQYWEGKERDKKSEISAMQKRQRPYNVAGLVLIFIPTM